MPSPITDQLADDVLHHRSGAVGRLIAHARALEEATNDEIDGIGAMGLDVEPMSTAQEAEYLIEGPRRDDYGPVEAGFEHVARLWAPILGLAAVSPRKVAACMVAWKMSRALTGATKHDTFVDMVGYALLWEQVEADDTPLNPPHDKD